MFCYERYNWLTVFGLDILVSLSYVIDGFIELTGDDLPQELVSYFQVTALEEEAKGLKGMELNPYISYGT